MPAFLAELELAAGANAHLDGAVALLRSELADPDELESRARRLVELAALCLQASLLVRHAPAEVADAFCATPPGRLGRSRVRHPAGAESTAPRSSSGTAPAWTRRFPPWRSRSTTARPEAGTTHGPRVSWPCSKDAGHDASMIAGRQRAVRRAGRRRAGLLEARGRPLPRGGRDPRRSRRPFRLSRCRRARTTGRSGCSGAGSEVRSRRPSGRRGSSRSATACSTARCSSRGRRCSTSARATG